MSEERPESTPTGVRLERVTTAGDVSVLVHGEVDISSAGRLRDEIVDAAASNPAHVTVVADAISFIDSSGLSALVDARDSIAPIVLRLRGVDAHLRRLLDISGLSGEFVIVDR